MSKHSDNFTLPVAASAAAAAVRSVLEDGRWKILDQSDASFFAQEPGDLLTRMYYHPSKVAMFLHPQDGDETMIELHGSIFGFGPLQKRRIRRVLAKLRDAIEEAAAGR